MSSSPRLPIGVLDAALDDIAAVDPVYLTTAEKQTALRDLSRLEARVQAAKLRVLAAADDIAVETGARSTAHWLADATRDNPGAVRRLSALAEALDQRWTEVGTALADGVVNVAQARVIAEALDALPAGLEPETVTKAEAYLLGEAARFGPPQLRRLAHSLLEVIAPEIADEAEYQRLVEEEKRARAATTLSFQRRGDGATDIRARIPDHVANRLKTYLDAYTSPRRGPLGDVDQLPTAQTPRHRVLRPAGEPPRPRPAPTRRHRDHRDGDPRPRHPQNRRRIRFRVRVRVRVRRDVDRGPVHRRTSPTDGLPGQHRPGRPRRQR